MKARLMELTTENLDTHGARLSERVMLISYESCWWATGTEPASEYLCAVDEAHLCERCRKQFVALDLLCRYERARGRWEGLLAAYREKGGYTLNAMVKMAEAELRAIIDISATTINEWREEQS